MLTCSYKLEGKELKPKNNSALDCSSKLIEIVEKLDGSNIRTFMIIK